MNPYFLFFVFYLHFIDVILGLALKVPPSRLAGERASTDLPPGSLKIDSYLGKLRLIPLA